jgi:hypothetical protein
MNNLSKPSLTRQTQTFLTMKMKATTSSRASTACLTKVSKSCTQLREQPFLLLADQVHLGEEEHFKLHSTAKSNN